MHAVVLLSDLLTKTRVEILPESTSKEPLLPDLVEVLEGEFLETLRAAEAG